MTLDISGTFDIETADWDRFVLGATFDGHRAKVFYSIDHLIDSLRNRGGTWFAHAGGVFDLLCVLERARIRGIPCQIDRSQHRITRITMGKLTLRDSYALWPSPLDELCGAVHIPVPSLPWKCTCDRDCGGYCRITERAAAGDPDLEDYCKADCVALYRALEKLSEFSLAAGIPLKGTIGHTAWKAAQTEIGIPDSTIDWDIWRAARRGDRGGRMTIVRPKAAGPGAHHDICNAYPAQLSRAQLPVGNARLVGGADARGALDRCVPGVYNVSVHVPSDSFLPPLPWNHGGQISYPTGRFTGSWTLPELVCAFERGVSVEAVNSAVIWESTAPIFEAVINRWYAIRREVGRKTPLGQWVGRLAKAITGKLAERPDRQRVRMHVPIDEVKMCSRTKSCTEHCTGKCGAYEQLDMWGFVWGVPYRKMAPSAYPQWSAYLRAMTRVQWLEQAERYGEDLCFGNTDSLWTLGRAQPAPLGDGLGQWEFQHAWCDLDVRSPTTYAFRKLPEAMLFDEDASWLSKRAISKVKKSPLIVRGVPGLTEDDWKRGRGCIDRGIVTFGRAVKSEHGLFRKRQRRWSLPSNDTAWFGDRLLGSRGITFPVDAAKIRERASVTRR